MSGKTNLAASAAARLLNQAKQTGDDYQTLLTSYCLERFLYRLAVSDRRDRFVRNGAMLLRLWSDRPYRATLDLDLLRRGDGAVDAIREDLRAIATTPGLFGTATSSFSWFARTCTVSDPQPGMVVSTGFAVVRPEDDLATDYAAFALRASYVVERVVANSKGASFPAINESEMATYELAALPRARATRHRRLTRPGDGAHPRTRRQGAQRDRVPRGAPHGPHLRRGDGQDRRAGGGGMSPEICERFFEEASA